MSPIEPGAVVFELTDREYARRDVVDVVFVDDSAKAILEHDAGRFAVDALELEARLLDTDDPSWIVSLYDGEDDGVPQWIPHPRRADTDADVETLERYSAPATPSDLRFEKIEATGSRNCVNDFLEGGRDGLVFHELGSVSSWKAAFVARNDDGEIVSAITLHHYHPSTNGVELAITRVANHEAAPANTSSYMIAKARDFAERAGYERIATYAGVGANEGVCYRAAGFEKDGEPVDVEGKDWKGERAGEQWTKQKYVDELEPDTYAGKSEQWAVDTLVDDVVEPGRAAYSADSPSAVLAD